MTCPDCGCSECDPPRRFVFLYFSGVNIDLLRVGDGYIISPAGEILCLGCGYSYTERYREQVSRLIREQLRSEAKEPEVA